MNTIKYIRTEDLVLKTDCPHNMLYNKGKTITKSDGSYLRETDPIFVEGNADLFHNRDKKPRKDRPGIGIQVGSKACQMCPNNRGMNPERHEVQCDCRD